MVLFWHRRDLRLEDNAGLYKALKETGDVQPVFIFDTEILDGLPEDDQRVLFIYKEIERIKKEYQEHDGDLWVFHGKPKEVFEKLVNEHSVDAVYTNRDYEPYALKRDKEIFEWLKSKDIPFKGTKDHVIFEKDEILKDDGDPYRVYSPYMKSWKSKLTNYYLKSYPTEEYLKNLRKTDDIKDLPSLADMGFGDEQKIDFPSREIDKDIIETYNKTRDYPAINGTTRLSVHLRFGTISIRKLARIAKKLNEKYLNELIWRDFYQMIIYHFPESESKAFKEKYDNIEWRSDEEQFTAWCEGKTGYPIVDAGMRQLNESGYMHNRVRMIVASFLTKDLLMDWRKGEAYFAEKLLDYDLASNVGGWQWAASSGVDAQPYFRIFNPESQREKYDEDWQYVKQWVPDYDTDDYPDPIVEHKEARERALDKYKEAVKEE
ncbi:MAG: deoxyribodipyrimidine photo-lyase [Brumimicrobium sp.]|nr:deoxyribodipyrimidine photo-lyase [Brumimicrobium sp.]